jgi:hypothetical protein
MAISLEDDKTINNWSDMLDYLDVAPFVGRGCEGDHLAFSREAIKGGFTFRAYYLINDAAGQISDKEKSAWQQRSMQPLDLTKEIAACQKQDAETKREVAQLIEQARLAATEKAKAEAAAAAVAAAERVKAEAAAAAAVPERVRAAAEAAAERGWLQQRKPRDRQRE